MSERLDLASKIIIATGQINYLVLSIDHVKQDMARAINQDKAFADGVKDMESALAAASEKLNIILSGLADFMNAKDMTMAIDVRLATPAFEVLLHGKDDIEQE